MIGPSGSWRPEGEGSGGPNQTIGYLRPAQSRDSDFLEEDFWSVSAIQVPGSGQTSSSLAVERRPIPFIACRTRCSPGWRLRKETVSLIIRSRQARIVFYIELASRCKCNSRRCDIAIGAIKRASRQQRRHTLIRATGIVIRPIPGKHAGWHCPQETSCASRYTSRARVVFCVEFVTKYESRRRYCPVIARAIDISRGRKAPSIAIEIIEIRV